MYGITIDTLFAPPLVFFSIPLILFLLLTYAFLALTRPLYAFGLVLAWLPFMPVAPKEIGPIELVFLLCNAITIGMLLCRALVRKYTWNYSPTDIPMMSLLFIMAVSIIPAKINGASPYDSFRQLAPFLGLIYYYLLKFEINDLQDMKIVTNFFIFCSLCYAIRIFLNLSMGVGSINNINNIRGHLDKIAFSCILYSFAAYLTAYLCFNVKKRFIYLSFLVLGFSAQFMTISRSVILNFIFLSFVYGIVSYRYNKSGIKVIQNYAIWIIAVFLIAGIAYFFEYLYGFTTGFIQAYFSRHSASYGGSNRLSELKTAFETMWNSALFGTGMGSSIRVEKEWNFQDMKYTHNIFGYFGFTLGMPGILALLALTFSVVSIFRKCRKTALSEQVRAIFTGHGVGLLSIFFISQITATYRHFVFSLYVGMALAIINKGYLMCNVQSKNKAAMKQMLLTPAARFISR